MCLLKNIEVIGVGSVCAIVSMVRMLSQSSLKSFLLLYVCVFIVLIRACIVDIQDTSNDPSRIVSAVGSFRVVIRKFRLCRSGAFFVLVLLVVQIGVKSFAYTPTGYVLGTGLPTIPHILLFLPGPQMPIPVSVNGTPYQLSPLDDPNVRSLGRCQQHNNNDGKDVED